jgi:hypothetical protein
MLIQVGRRQFVIAISTLVCGAISPVSAQVGSAEVRIRLDDSALKTIPLTTRQQLAISQDTSPIAQDFIASAPPQKAIPIILIAVGVLSVPIIWNAILEMIRETEYGGIIIDLRQHPAEITNSKKIPADYVMIISQDGKEEIMESLKFSQTTLSKLLSGKSFVPSKP